MASVICAVLAVFFAILVLAAGMRMEEHKADKAQSGANFMVGIICILLTIASAYGAGYFTR